MSYKLLKSPLSKFLGNFNYRRMGLNEVLSNNKKADEIIRSIKNELSMIKNEKIQLKITEIEKDNVELRKKVNLAREQLIKLEILNGKKVISASEIGEDKFNEDQKTGIEELAVKKKKVTVKATDDACLEVIDVGRLDFRVGKIIEVSKHPDADSLYLEKIDCGETNPRIVVSGLVKFIPIEEMQNRLVIVLCNLKPAKMRGITSEAMVMCASSPDKVEILNPPSDSKSGDLVTCQGFLRNPDKQLNSKKKIFETIAVDLKTNNEFIACYKGIPLHVEGKGVIQAETLKNVQIK